MSLQSNWREEIPEDTAVVGQQILAEDNPYRLVGDRVNDFLRLEDFRAMYSEVGRGAICPIVLSLVILFQFLENVPDREAAERAVARIDWKYALHMPLTWQGFHYADLSNFRRRLLEHGAERLVFERILEWARSLGFIKRRGKQRSDSTHVLGRVERMSRLELVWETMRVALREIERAAPKWYGEVVPATFHDVYVDRHSDWRLSQEEVRKGMQKTGKDGFWLLDHLDASAPEKVLALPEVEVLREVWEQQFTRRGGKVKVKSTPIKGKEVICSPHDPQARWAKKRSMQWVGYKIHVTETAEDDVKVQFITDIAATAANDTDGEATGDIQTRLIERGLRPTEQYVDQGYITGLNLARSAERGIELIGRSSLGGSTKPEGYRQKDFTLDLDARRAVCPLGNESQSWSERSAPEAPDDPERREVKVTFGAACEACSARSQCAPGKSGRSLNISAFYDELSARRAEQETEQFKQRLRRRSGVEGTIFGLTWCHGARRARYRGQDKMHLQALFTGAAANLKRISRAARARRECQRRARPPTLEN